MVRIMGLDVGDKTIGVALSDPLGLTAQGKEVIKRTSQKKDIQYIKKLTETFSVDELVVGLPLNMDASQGPRAELILRFVDQLKKKLSLPVITYDERLSTVQANRCLISFDVSRSRRKQVIDKVAAAIILQAYLDRRREVIDHGHKDGPL